MASTSTSALNDETERDVLPWLKLAEDLRILKLDVDLNMPQICVMGDQSSGKSSVLEALSGIPFPRGAGLVTRCPIRMVMKRARAGESWCANVSTSVNANIRMARSISELSAILDNLTNELCVGSNNFSTESIIVDLTSPDACDLTVVDLPGIIRTVTAGQNVSVIEQVNRMIKSYLLDKRTIILAVIPANQDIATVDILERAQGVDPTGERTIGVLTKTDLIGPGNEDEVLAVVNNVRKPLALGYVMVKNRSQKDIAENVSTAKARENENLFFSNHPSFRSVSNKHWGVAQLSKKLTYLLVNRIKQELSPMRLLVEKQLNEVRNQLRSMPSSYASAKTTSERQKLLVSIVQEYVRHLSDCIRGEYRDRMMVRHSELRMYTIALRKFEDFKQAVTNCAPQFKEEQFIQDLALQIEQLRGRELPGFMSSQAFYMCMSQYVDMWMEPGHQLIKDVQQVALDVSSQLADLLLSQYPGLRNALVSVTEKILVDAANCAIEKLGDCSNREKDPFTLNDFLQQWVNKIRFDRFSSAVDVVFDNTKNPASNWPALKEEVYAGMRHWYRSTHSVSAMASAQDMSAIMEAYWHLAAKRYIDSCCMLTDNDVLGKLPASLQDEMYQFIKDDAKLEVFFAENPETLQQKLSVESLRDRLVQASSKLATISLAPAPLTTIGATSTPAVAVAAPSANKGVTPPQPGASTKTAAATGSNSTKVQSSISTAPPQSSSSTRPVPQPQSGSSPLTFQVAIGDSGLGLVLNVTSTGALGSGVYVKEFGPNSPCIAAGIRVGDRIVSINDVAVADIEAVRNIIKTCKGPVRIQVLR